VNQTGITQRPRRRWLSWWKHDLAMALSGDLLWLARPGDGDPVGLPAYVAVATANGRVVAVGSEARAGAGREPGTVAVVRVGDPAAMREDPALLRAAFRHLLREHGGRRLLPPRGVLVAAASLRREVRVAALEAGAREVMLLEPAMAAAIGAGLAVEEAAPRGVMVLDRDTCSFAVIALAGVVGGFAEAQGVGRMLEDIALHTLATHSRTLDVDLLDAAIRREGLGATPAISWEARLDEIGTGRMSATSLAEPDVRRMSLPFQHWLAWQYRRALAALPPARRRDAESAPILLVGPYAEAAGMRELVEAAVGRPVTVPVRPAACVILGARSVLADLDFLLRYVATANRRA